MSDLNDYPEEHPDTGKVMNPITGNWVQKSYAKGEGLLEQAKEHTQKHFMQEDSSKSEKEEIDELLKAAEEADPGEGFDLSDEDLERIDERADIDHPEIPESKFPDEEGFDPAENEEEFGQPPTPEGLDKAAQTQQKGEDYQGIYSGPSKKRPQPTEEKGLEQKHEDEEVRYVRTEHGGMKMVYPEDQE